MQKAGTASVVFFLITLFSCVSHKKAPDLFVALGSGQTGLSFTNKLTSTDSFNLFKYMYFYNGAGVGAADFNNDGKTDLFFSSNQGGNTMYLNKGKLHFEDVSAAAKIPRDSAWSTGVSVVDINNDGLMDLYVCRVGNYRMLKSRNQLLVCRGIDKNGVPYYKDEAHAYGLDFSGFSTQAVFFDYDMDGDLDMFLLNHSVHDDGSFRPRKDFVGTYSELSGDRLYRNDDGHFTDVTHEAGINSSSISYGLGIVAADINLDGYPDLYAGNDFHENDYLYINQKNGTLKEELNDHIMHTSQFSMGVDAADADNDGYPEIVSMDMLPGDRYILKRSLGEDEYDIFYQKINYGYNYQYTRNNLQYNRRNGMFSEIGLYAGVAATDWSWAALWMDFDNDGLKDLFISNGIPKRMNDIDYINFVSSQEVQQKLQDNRMNETEKTLIDKFPEIKLPNKFYRNNGEMMFADLEDRIGNNAATYSNGSVYADFDNDGDLDVVVNNIDDAALLYENKNNNPKSVKSLEIKLKGPAKNINAIGAKAVVYANKGVRVYEKFPVHGFQSSMEEPLHIGLANTRIDSMFLIWPNNTYQRIYLTKDTAALSIAYQPNLPVFDYKKITDYNKAPTFSAADITNNTGLKWKHEENFFQEFTREPLIPHMLSTEGPALAVGDINQDGFEDVFIGSAKGNKSAVFLQNAKGIFSKSDEPALDNDSTWEDVAACWTDVNNDGHPDLVVASGGNEYYGEEKYLLPRVYLNDGKAHLSALANAFDSLFVNASCVSPCDFNGDGYTDLFIGGRDIPWDYGRVPRSYLLQNDKTGRFKDVTALHAKDLSHAGFVTQSVWCDIDKDGDQDLLLSSEWNGLSVWINNKGFFKKRILTNKKGWWNFVIPCDVDNDGDIDLAAGNLGLNSRLKASEKEPVNMYYNDFDGNEKNEQVLTYYMQGREIPFANKSELEKQMPFLKKKFLYASDFAKASLPEIFSKEKLDNAKQYSADYFANSILINDGKLNFTVIPLPWQAQLAPYRDAAITDANGDGLPDIFLVGNYYENNIEMGRYDADFGTMLINHGNDHFSAENLDVVQLKGQPRHISKINIAGKEAFVIAQNNDSVRIIQLTKPVLQK